MSTAFCLLYKLFTIRLSRYGFNSELRLAFNSAVDCKYFIFSVDLHQ